MANYYNDNESLKFQLGHPDMDRIIELKEEGFADKDKYDFAPQDLADAKDNYERVLDIVGEIAGTVIEENSEGVDKEGPRCENNRVAYASGTRQNQDVLTQAGVYGIALPRQYGGLNFAMTPYVMSGEMVSRADAGFANIWGLQDCAETIYEFASDEQKAKYLPLINKGYTCSMDLTEPDAGSDLQSVQLKATYDEAQGCWLLNGVKRFITNGDAQIKLVLARSEEGTSDARGLSYFICENHFDNAIKVRRIEDKLGIHGSPTTELVFTNAKAELVGERKLGLIKYVMSLMNGARLGVGAQSVGLSESAWREAVAYAADRRQFGKSIDQMPAVQEMIALIKARLDASRALLYETARFVDFAKIYEDRQRKGLLTKEERPTAKKYQKLADAFTPECKLFASEYANQNAYDCLQVHGGSGYMRDYKCERLYRDARIMNVYEGTSQLQVVAAIRHVTTGTYLSRLQEYQAMPVDASLEGLKQRLDKMVATYQAAVEAVEAEKSKDAENGQAYIDLCARKLVEMAGLCIMGYLLVLDATRAIQQQGPDFSKSANVFVNHAEAEVAKHDAWIKNSTVQMLQFYK